MTVPLTVAVLSVIESSPIPVATPDLIACVDDFRPNIRQRVWVHLRTLSAGGLVRRVEPKGWKPGRPVSWAGGKS